jgi:hypothetical protein
MVAINFRAQFTHDIRRGAKRQAIRAKARCKPGDCLQLRPQAMQVSGRSAG